jgi:hypothetical protein
MAILKLLLLHSPDPAAKSYHPPYESCSQNARTIFDSYRSTLLAQKQPGAPALLDEIEPLLDELEARSKSRPTIKNPPVMTDNFAADQEHRLELSLCLVDQEAKAINPPGKDKLQVDSA